VTKFLLFAAFEVHDDIDAAMDTALLAADWLQELPENLDMCIAQRDFEGAVDLFERGTGMCDIRSFLLWSEFYTFHNIFMVP